ncbi:hypothetical protein L7F22_012980 [Adiantum nelumboides]|nr:hypothetical protein [Adiantum nelumboides]
MERCFGEEEKKAACIANQGIKVDDACTVKRGGHVKEEEEKGAILRSDSSSSSSRLQDKGCLELQEQKKCVQSYQSSYQRSHDVAFGGIVIYDVQGNLVRKQGLKRDAMSNNEAVYMAFEDGLHICLQLGIKCLQIKGDALLVVKQVLGVWKNKNSKLKNLCSKVKLLLKKFEAWSLQHVERSQNNKLMRLLKK